MYKKLLRQLHGSIIPSIWKVVVLMMVMEDIYHHKLAEFSEISGSDLDDFSAAAERSLKSINNLKT